MRLQPHCKINIGLRIVRKREDGYHDLETLFYPVFGLHDVLEVEAIHDTHADGIDYTQTGIQVNCPKEDNLVVRCYQRMRLLYPTIGAVRVRLDKQIPFGAGLGGGSSDAAFMARALNELFHLGLTHQQLIEVVSPLGADCAFFLYDSPCFATGIGDQLTPTDFSLKGLRLIMIKPETGISTREAYSGVRKKGEFAYWKEALAAGPTQHNAITDEAFHNDFEDTVFALHPELAVIRQQLLDAGAVYAAMSGSGSTIFGLFEYNTESSSPTHLRLLDKDFSSMVIFNNTLG